MDTYTTFLIGAIGACAPEIVRLYDLRNKGGEKITAFYVVISLVFCSLGGLVAVVLPATTAWGAFYGGLSTPVVISTGLKKGLDRHGGELRGEAGRLAPEPQRPPSLIKFLRAL